MRDVRLNARVPVASCERLAPENPKLTLVRAARVLEDRGTERTARVEKGVWPVRVGAERWAPPLGSPPGLPTPPAPAQLLNRWPVSPALLVVGDTNQ